MKLKHKYFAIDFDGTIAYDAYPNIGKLIPGAKETMAKIKELGGEIVIWTCRTHQAKEDAKKFLDDNGIIYDKFNEPFDANVNEYGGDHARKIFADVYIDDRSIHLEGKPVDWDDIHNNIFLYDEEFNDGDTIECYREIPGNFFVGAKHKLEIKNGTYVVGPMGTDLESLKMHFKKVSDASC